MKKQTSSQEKRVLFQNYGPSIVLKNEEFKHDESLEEYVNLMNDDKRDKDNYGY